MNAPISVPELRFRVAFGVRFWAVETWGIFWGAILFHDRASLTRGHTSIISYHQGDRSLGSFQGCSPHNLHTSMLPSSPLPLCFFKEKAKILLRAVLRWEELKSKLIKPY